MKITGLMRVKNEARWIERSVRSILPCCDRVLVMDDHSTDGTPEILSGIENVSVFESPFQNLDEVRDKNWLLDLARDSDWILMIDGDEALEQGAGEQVQRAASNNQALAYAFRILYLWDREDQVRTDGVYGRFARPSMFRPYAYRFESTHSDCNFHCGNAPIALHRNSPILPVALLHFGYLHREDRERKFAWYTKLDGQNPNEDGYRHMVIGDLFPKDSRFRHGGPLELETFSQRN